MAPLGWRAPRKMKIGPAQTFLRFEATACPDRKPLSLEQRTRPKEKFPSRNRSHWVGRVMLGPRTGAGRMYFRHLATIPRRSSIREQTDRATQQGHRSMRSGKPSKREEYGRRHRTSIPDREVCSWRFSTPPAESIDPPAPANSALATASADPTDAGNGSGPRIFLRRLAHDEPSGSTQAAAKPDRGSSLAASDERAKVKSQLSGDVTSTTG